MSEKSKPSRMRSLIEELKHDFQTGKQALFRVSLVFVLLTIFTLFSFDFFKDYDFFGDGQCKLVDVPQTNEMQTHFYDFIMRHRFSEGTPKFVAMVTISEGVEPLSVITNTCESRRFLAALVHQLDQLNVKAIAVDESFTKGSCPDDDTYRDGITNKVVNTNDQLRQSFELAHPPIIVGWGTHEPTSTAQNKACLVLNDPFDFNPKNGKVATFSRENVCFGLIRLNSNDLKIPLRWSAYPNQPEDATEATSQDSFSLATARAAAPLIQTKFLSDSVLAYDIDNGVHPYSSFERKLPTWTALDVLCNVKDSSVGARWGCGKIDVAHVPFKGLSGKVVVIGLQIPSDQKPFLGGQKYGVELHANYIEALLDGRYVRTVSACLDKGTVVFFVILMLTLQFLTVRKFKNFKKLEDSALWLTWLAFAVLALITACLLIFKGLFFPAFFLTCFPIFISLVCLTLYQVQMVITRKHRAERKGATH